MACVGLSRSKLDENGKPGTWQNYYNGNFQAAALPEGFTKENVGSYYEKNGGFTGCVLPLQKEYGNYGENVDTWFSVAKIKGTPYYIGVEETSPSSGIEEINIRFSRDLINWSMKQIIQREKENWGNADFTYPRFLDKSGMTNYEIDPKEFYLYGKKVGEGGFKINSAKLSIIFKPNYEKLSELSLSYNKLLNGNSELNKEYENYFKQLEKEGCQNTIKSITKSPQFLSKTQKMTNSDLVKLMFEVILARVPEESDKGYLYYVNKLNNSSISRDEFIEELLSVDEAIIACVEGKTISVDSSPTPVVTAIQSPTPIITAIQSPTLTKNEELVIFYYLNFLDQKKDASHNGVKWHVNYLERNGCAEDVKQFANSAETRAIWDSKSNAEYISLLYKVLLNRKADGLANGSLWWIEQLNSGRMSRISIIDEISKSQEAQNVCRKGI
jgi:hypothetical protein